VSRFCSYKPDIALEKPLSGAATYIKSQPIAGFRGTSMGCTP
jgi:hypothetical protein